MEYDNHKSGLGQVDKEKTAEIINNISRGSYFYINEQRKRECRDKMVEQLKQKEAVFAKLKCAYDRFMAGANRVKTEECDDDDDVVVGKESDRKAANPCGFLPNENVSKYRNIVQKVDSIEAQLEQEREAFNVSPDGFIRIFSHVDMDMFFAACEEKRIRHRLRRLHRSKDSIAEDTAGENTEEEESDEGDEEVQQGIATVIDALEKRQQTKETADKSSSRKEEDDYNSPHYRIPLPLAVGSMSMLSTTNYLARQYGVRSAMPGFIGKKLCPDLIIVPVDFHLYKKESVVVQNYVQEAFIDSLVPPEGEGEHSAELREAKVEELRYRYFTSFGADEFTVELTDMIRHRAPRGTVPSVEEQYEIADAIVGEMRRGIFELTELSCSAGTAPTPLLAKIVSNYKKPDGQYTLRIQNSKSETQAFLFSQELREMPGIGKSQEHVLNGIGIKQLGDIFHQRYLLYFLFPLKSFMHLLSAAIGTKVGVYEVFASAPQGTNPSATRKRARSESSGATGLLNSAENSRSLDASNQQQPPTADRKSVGQERTFYNLHNRADLQKIAVDNLRDSVPRLVKHGLLCGRVCLKMKKRTFQVRNYSKTVASYCIEAHSRSSDSGGEARHTTHTQDFELLHNVMDSLLLPLLDDYAEYRLLGVRLDDLITEGEMSARAAAGPSASPATSRAAHEGPLDRLLFGQPRKETKRDRVEEREIVQVHSTGSDLLDAPTEKAVFVVDSSSSSSQLSLGEFCHSEAASDDSGSGPIIIDD